MGNLRASLLAGNTARSIALLVFIAIPLGNLLCESGNLLAGSLGLYSHYFNKWFLITGIAGVIGFSITLFRR